MDNAGTLFLRVGQVGNLRPIGNRPVNNSGFRQADYQSAAGYQPAHTIRETIFGQAALWGGRPRPRATPWSRL